MLPSQQANRFAQQNRPGNDVVGGRGNGRSGGRGAGRGGRGFGSTSDRVSELPEGADVPISDQSDGVIPVTSLYRRSEFGLC